MRVSGNRRLFIGLAPQKFTPGDNGKFRKGTFLVEKSGV